MKQGGNAVDAAVATGFALAVTYPSAGNIGGGGFMVIRTPDNEVVTLDFRETAPAAADRDMYLDDDGNVIEGLSTRSHKAAGVPGSVAGLLAALDAASFGTRPDRTRPRFRANLAEDKRRVWIAERDGVPVGKLHARRDRDGVWVHDLCTDPDVRRLGLGREMVLRCTRRLLDGGLGRAETAVWLEVRTDNAAAVATYARCAFETVRTDTMLELPLEAFIAVFTQTSMDTPA